MMLQNWALLNPDSQLPGCSADSVQIATSVKKILQLYNFIILALLLLGEVRAMVECFVQWVAMQYRCPPPGVQQSL
jgi:hypothetical protein